MLNQRTVLVTGVGSYWGRRVAAHLLDRPEQRVIGLDTLPPVAPLPGLSFIQADIWEAQLADILRAEQVETLCHLTPLQATRHTEAAFDLNVAGVLKIFAASADAKVRKLILMSSTMVYGARPGNSAFLAEDHALADDAASHAIRDLVEIETFCARFRLQMPEMTITVLRFPGIVGPTADTPMTRFLATRLVPVPLGFDPVLQVIHEDDVVAALAHVVDNDAAGIFNVAAEEAIPLSKLMAQAGRLPLPLPQPTQCQNNPLTRRLRLPTLPPDYLRYPWVGALDKMHNVLGFVPQRTAEETLREFADRRQH